MLKQKKKLSKKVFSFIWIRNRLHECSLFLLRKLFKLLRVIPSVLLAMLPNLNLRNLENVLQRNLRTNRAGECIFRASGGTSFKNFSVSRQHSDAFVGSMYVPICSEKNSGYVSELGKSILNFEFRIKKISV